MPKTPKIDWDRWDFKLGSVSDNTLAAMISETLPAGVSINYWSVRRRRYKLGIPAFNGETVPWWRYSRFLGVESDRAVQRRMEKDGLTVSPSAIYQYRKRNGIEKVENPVDQHGHTAAQRRSWAVAAKNIGITYEAYREKRNKGQRWCTRCEKWHPEELFEGAKSFRPKAANCRKWRLKIWVPKMDRDRL